VIALDNYFFVPMGCTDTLFLPQLAATFGCLINELPNKHKMLSSGILKLLAYLKYLISKLGIYGLHD